MLRTRKGLAGCTWFSIPNPPKNVTSASSQENGGYLYHPASGRLVRLSTRAAVQGPFTLAADPVQLWHVSDIPNDRPGRVVFDVVTPH